MSRLTAAVVVATLVALFVGVLVGGAFVALDRPACPRDRVQYQPGGAVCSDRPLNRQHGSQP